MPGEKNQRGKGLMQCTAASLAAIFQEEESGSRPERDCGNVEEGGARGEILDGAAPEKALKACIISMHAEMRWE